MRTFRKYFCHSKSKKLLKLSVTIKNNVLILLQHDYLTKEIIKIVNIVEVLSKMLYTLIPSNEDTIFT